MPPPFRFFAIERQDAFVEDRQAAKEAGMDVHIAKPIDAELLKKKIAEYCR